MDYFKILLLSLFSFVFGCNTTEKSELFQKKNGTWYYRDEAIPGSDAESFEAFTEHYAKDKNYVYYCDTYRRSQDYFTTKRNRISTIEQADPLTFKSLKNGYARDKANMFFEGIIFPVKDINSFQILDYSFAKDRISGYYMQIEIAGSDGNTFTALDDHYSKDKTHVYYSNIETGESNTPPLAKSTALKGAIADSFITIDVGYASDTRRIYYKGDVLTDAVQNFKILPYDYAKNETQVYYMGKPIAHADAPSFMILDRLSDSADAKDKYFFYQQGREIKR